MNNKLYHIYEVWDYKGGELYSKINLSVKQVHEYLSGLVDTTLKEKKEFKLVKSAGAIPFKERCVYAGPGDKTFAIYCSENEKLTCITDTDDKDYNFVNQHFPEFIEEYNSEFNSVEEFTLYYTEEYVSGKLIENDKLKPYRIKKVYIETDEEIEKLLKYLTPYYGGQHKCISVYRHAIIIEEDTHNICLSCGDYWKNDERYYINPEVLEDLKLYVKELKKI